MKTVANRGMIVDHNLNITAPALIFLDASLYDLRLRGGSPAIDAGNGESAPDRDIVGTSRPQGNAVDVGAYEHTGK